MRTTIDMPDALYRRTKAVAALRGSTLKDLIVEAVERDLSRLTGKKPASRRRVKLPLIHLKHTKKLDLSGFDFDDLLT
jgi:hypothetical protein